MHWYTVLGDDTFAHLVTTSIKYSIQVFPLPLIFAVGVSLFFEFFNEFEMRLELRRHDWHWHVGPTGLHWHHAE